jgi:hypothetical protein
MTHEPDLRGLVAHAVPDANTIWTFREALKKALDCEELLAGQDSRISVSLDDADPEDEADWTGQHE